MIGQISASNQLRTSSELAPNMFGASSELASVMEFGYNNTREINITLYVYTKHKGMPIERGWRTYGTQIEMRIKLCRINILLILDSMRWFSHRRIELAEDRAPRGPLRKKMPHEDRAPEDDSRTKCRTFSFFFVPGDLDLWLLTLTLELGRDSCTLHVTAKFHRPMFNRSQVIVLTNKQTNTHKNWQTDAAENIHLAPLCYAGG